MFALIKSLVDRIMVTSHHIGSGLTGAFAFGFVGYLLDIGGFRTQALTKGGLDSAAITAIIGVLAVFMTVNVLMKRLMGKHGVF
jgi:hypothetical protein